MEQSRHLLEERGVRVAAVSYDSQEILRGFAEKYGIGFPLLSDPDSAVIRSFGIFNTNMAPGLRAYGVPHPVEYLVSRDGVVARKYFVPNYQHRVTASAVALSEYGAVDNGAQTVVLRSGALSIRIGFASATAFAGQQVAFFAKFSLEPGWHVYGSPLPEPYTPATVTFDDARVIRQSFDLPAASPLRFEALNEELPVYAGPFEGLGSILLKFPLEAGPVALTGQVRFQQCSETTCEAPESIPFELMLTLRPFLVATPGG